jgi:hypothetical protein
MTPQERQREVIGFDDNEVEFYPLQMARANESFWKANGNQRAILEWLALELEGDDRKD